MYVAIMTVSEARARLPEVLDRVAAGEEITITRHGAPAAVLLRPEAVRSRRASGAIERAREVDVLLAAAREQPLAPPAVAGPRVDELVDALRADRDRS